ncbi:MAG: hypothetical protein R6V77_03365 [Candidatus Cloacimonadaceae bacterium]
MNWVVPAEVYHIWTDFSLEIDSELVFAIGKCYHLTGQNGAGKSSFIKKVLIPQLLKQQSLQFILYLEQQVQSQLDAVKANAALQKPAMHINTIDEMFDYQLKQLSRQLAAEPRPVIIILDETILSDLINQWLNKVSVEQACLIYISHQDFDFPSFKEVIKINLKPVSVSLSRIEV